MASLLRIMTILQLRTGLQSTKIQDAVRYMVFVSVAKKATGGRRCRSWQRRYARIAGKYFWEETQEEYPHQFGLNLGEWMNQDDI